MSESEKAVLSLCDEVWQWRIAESPELASFCGFHQYDDKWDDVTEERYILREKCVQEFLRRAESLDVTSCSPDVALSYTLIVGDLRLYLKGADSKSYLLPFNYLDGIHVDANHAITNMKFRTEADFDKYISRLENFPQRIQQVESLLVRAVEEGMTYHSASVESIPKQIDGIFNSDLDDIGLLAPFKDEHANIPADSLKAYQVRAKELITSGVFPALTNLKSTFMQKYLPNTRPQPGICSLKNGQDLYQKCLDFHLSCSLTPLEVHNRGLSEVARIRAQILKVAAKENLGENLADILKAIIKKQENFFSTREEVLKYVEDLCRKKIRPKLTSLFKDLSTLPMKIQATPDFMKNAPAGMYLNGLPDGSRDGVYYINNHNLKECLPYQLTALSLHEGEPGHHMQGVISLSATHLPDFRRYSEDGKYYMVPLKFSFNTAYVEGWGLYCEALGEELGLYEDSFDLLGRYSFEIFRAARLVVDTGLHAFGWSREKALKYMVDNTLSVESELAQEIDRYITWPGQACGYKIGELKIWELRRKAEEQLGEKFDIKEFHSRVLNCGAVPLHVLESIVDQFIQEGKDVQDGQ